jgi:hypothetical protein
MNSILKGNSYDTLTLSELISKDFGNKNIAEWREVDDAFLEKFASIMVDPVGHEQAAIEIDDELNFNEVFGYDYLAEKFPGLDPSILDIIVEDAKENKEELLAGFVLDPGNNITIEPLDK